MLARQLAFGGYVASLNGSLISGMWTAEETGRSSTYRELKAIYYLCVSCIEQLRQKIFTDNCTAAAIVSIGSPVSELQQVVLAIFSVCLASDISLEAEWLPRESSKQPDMLSRFIDKGDWSINPYVFKMIELIWGPHTSHRFASNYNAQIPEYNSRFASPGSSRVDEFAQDWRRASNWLCPPVDLVVPVVRKLQSCRGTLIVPEWPSSMFWPFLRLSP